MLQNFVSKLSDSEKKIFYLTVLVVLIMGFDRLFLSPALNKTASIDQEIINQKISIKQDLRILAYKDKISNEYEQYKKYFTDTVESEDVIKGDILSRIELMKNRLSVECKSAAAPQALTTEEFSQYFINLDCSSQLDDMVKFMYEINSSDDLLKVVQFNMSPKRGSDSDVNASMMITKMIVSNKISEIESSEK